MDLSNRITQLRKQEGFSQENLGEKLNVSRQAVSKWESGQSTPDLDYIIKMCEIFNVSADYLILGKEPLLEQQTTGTNKDIQVNVAPAPVNLVSSLNKPFWLGIVLLLLGGIGVLVFLVLSIINPWGTLIGKYYFEGLLGYLFGTKTILAFILCCLVGCFGLGLTIYSTFSKSTNVSS